VYRRQNLSDNEGIERLLFDLASESRLGILRELSVKNLKMNEIARKLDLTATENFRQLQRLSEAKLTQKQPDGNYNLTQIGKLTLQLLPSLEFIYKNKDYFLNHDIWRLPYPFVNRIGELSAATLSMDVIENINLATHVVADAEKYVWGLGDRAMESVGQAMAKSFTSGVKFRFMFHESLLPKYKPMLNEMPSIEKRTLSAIPAMIFCTEKEAAICLPTTEGRLDYAGFFARDPMFVNWVKELFEFYWNKGQRCFA
jgi:predicted transcriptional regulator